MIWLYDGEWDGLLSAVFQVFARKDEEAVIQSRDAFEGLSLFPVQTVATNPEHAARVGRGMARLSGELPKTAYRAFLSEQPERERALLGTLRLGFAHDRNPLPLLQEEPVGKLCALARRVTNEQRLFLGVTRLLHVGGDLYAADIQPETHILPLMGHHFHRRFNDQRLLIRDVGRLSALVSTPEEWWITRLPVDEALPPLPRDAEMTALWRSYFKAVANPARENLKLQQQYVPLKYRGNITEFQWE